MATRRGVDHRGPGGRRHLTVLHGDLRDSVEADHFGHIYNAIVEWVAPRGARIGGHTDHHFTVTIDGPDAEEVLAGIADFVMKRMPPHWRVLGTARAIG